MLGRIAEVDHKFQSEKTCCIKELISAKGAYFLHCLILIPFLSNNISTSDKPFNWIVDRLHKKT